MATDHPDFIQCAYNAYESGYDFDAIEEHCACSKITAPGTLPPAPPTHR